MNKNLQNLDAEESVIGSCLIDKTAYWKVQETGICVDHFTDPDCRKLWAAIKKLNEQGVTCDSITIVSADKTINIKKAIELANNTPGANNVIAWAKLVVNASLARDTLKAAQKIAGLDIPGDEAANEAMRIVQEIQLQTKADTTTLAAGAKDFLEDLQRRLSSGNNLVGPSTGIAKLDAKTGGLEPGLIIVGGRPGSGKSAWVLQIALEASVARRERVFFASLEMDRGQLTKRAVSHLAGVSMARLKSPKDLDEQDWPRITQAMTVMKTAPLIISDSSSQTAVQIAAQIRKEYMAGGLSMAIVDYLGLLKMSNKTEIRHEYGAACKILRAVAKDLGIPVILLAQLNRGLESRANKRPMMSDLKESGDIEQDADVVIFIYRESYHEAGGASSDGIVEIILGKQRQGETGVVPMMWKGATQRFEDYKGPWPIQKQEESSGYKPYGKSRY